MPTKSLEDMRLELQMFDALPPEVRKLIADADMIPGDVVEATYAAWALRGQPTRVILDVLTRNLKYTKYKTARKRRR